VTGTAKPQRAVPVRATTSGSFDADSDYCGGFAIDLPSRNEGSTEQWARTILEGAPVALRWFIVAGWRFVLGLRLGPRHSTEHILGWRITRRLHDETVLEVRSAFLTAHLVFDRDGSRLVWSTFVRYDRRIAALIWPPVSLLHRRIVPYTLARAAPRVST